MKRLTNVITMIVMIVIALISVAPILWMVTGAFRPYQELFKYTSLNIHLIVPRREWTWKNFHNVIFNTRNPFLRYIWNTLLVASIVTILVLIINSMAAFAFCEA